MNIKKNIIDFLASKKEYVSCEWLEYGINFGAIGIYNCCYFIHSNKNDRPLSYITKENKYDICDFFKKKNNMRKLHRKGVIHERCKGCCCLESRKWDKKFVIRRLVIGPNTKCYVNCIYCYTYNKKKFFNAKEDVPIFDILEYLINRKIIAEDCIIEFNNGEPTIMNRFEDIINMFIDKKVGKITVSSSGIEYSDALAKGLKLEQCNLIISPDSANRELYKQIKCVDKHDIVWTNIKKYALEVRNNVQFSLKYILIPNINDKEDIIREFVDKVKENNVETILIDIEMNWFKKEKDNVREIERILYIVRYMETYIQQNDLRYKHCPSVCEAVYLYPSLYNNMVIDL